MPWKQRKQHVTEGLASRERWKEHFEEVLNRHIPDDPVTNVEIDPIINEISTDPKTKTEIRSAIRKMKNSRIIKSRHE